MAWNYYTVTSFGFSFCVFWMFHLCFCVGMKMRSFLPPLPPPRNVFFSQNKNQTKGTQVFPYNLVLSIINSFLTDESNRIFFDWSSFGHYQRSRDIKYLSYELWLVLVLKVLLATSGTVWPMLCLKFYSLAANTVVQLSPVLLWS